MSIRFKKILMWFPVAGLALTTYDEIMEVKGKRYVIWYSVYHAFFSVLFLSFAPIHYYLTVNS